MIETGSKKVEGEKILNNYKKQLAERMAREKVERGQLLDEQNKTKNASSSQGFMDERFIAYESNEVPDPELLRRILERKSKFV